MTVIEVRRDIAATPEAVWAILTDNARLVAGNMGILRIDGRIAAGEKIRLESATAPGRIFTLKIPECAAPRQMIWTSGAPLVFNGTRTFTLEAIPAGTRFHMAEVYRGLLLPLIWKSIPDMQPGFETFGDGLKHLAERG